MSKSEIFDVCVMNIQCPKCTKEIKDFTLNSFRTVRMDKGPMYQCPYCYCDFYIENIEFKNED